MTPKTRSGGTEPSPSVVYRSTPTLRQAQFPSRRKRVRTYGRQQQQQGPFADLDSNMKQQTLTQIDFVSSFNDDEDDDVVQLSDASEDNKTYNNTDKENRVSSRKQRRTPRPVAEEEEEEARIPDTEDEGNDEDQAPVSRRRKRHVAFADATGTSNNNKTSKSKRRRTLGDEHRRNTMSEERATARRRRTLGDVPASSAGSRYHTQTLTQFIGRGSFVADSEDEVLDDGFGRMGAQNDDGFLDWLGTNQEEEPASPTTAVRAAAAANASTTTSPAKQPAAPSREESVIPQTPVKNIRFQLPPSAQAASPSPSRIAKYGAPDKYNSPSKLSAQVSQPAALTELTGKPQSKSPRKGALERVPSLVIKDSYASDGWTSLGGGETQPKWTPSQTQSQMYSTPAEAPAQQQDTRQSQSAQTDIDADVYHEASSQLPKAKDQEQDAFTTAKPMRVSFASVRQEIPDSDDEDEAFNGDDNDSEGQPDETLFAAGAETQLIMDQLQSSVQKWTRPQQPPLLSSSVPSSPRRLHTSSSISGSATTPQSAPPSSAIKQKQPPAPPSTICHDIPPSPTTNSTPIRKPLHYNPLDTQGLPLESQRVPVATLHAFSPATARTDILLPLSTIASSALVSGHQVSITLPFKIPAQVARFWLLTDTVLRYLSTTEPTAVQQPNGNWMYHIAQVYELNNPVQEEDMRAEEWIHGQLSRYAYLPPAVVSQLLWNLRHALFDETEDEEAAVDKIPSTPDKVPMSSSQVLQAASSPVQPYQRPPASTMPAPPPPERPQTTRKNYTQPIIRPSQATTASQASVSTPPRSTQKQQQRQVFLSKELATTPVPPMGLQNSSSDSLVFDDHGGSSISIPYAVAGLDDESPLTSQLLTRSQMLPESLVRDEVRFSNEIGDSDDE